MNEIIKEEKWRYYAYASRYVFEEGGKMRNGIEFEAIQSKKVAAFMKRDRSFAIESQDEAYISLLDIYLEHGVSSDAFYKKKIAYFGDEDNIYYLTVWFDEPAEAKAIVFTDWYVVEKGEFYDCQVTPFMKKESTKMEKCSIHLMKSDEKEVLKNLMAIRSFEGKETKMGEKTNEDLMMGVGPNTKFLGAHIYYVGAALCVGLHSAFYHANAKRWMDDKIEAYYDFGCNSGASSSNPYVCGNAYKAEANLVTILKDLKENPAKTIIISHWHRDHISILGRMENSSEYDSFWAQSVWYVPNDSNIFSNLVAQKLKNYEKQLKLFDNVFPANNKVYPIEGNPNLILGKIDAFSPLTGDGKHPHHHGIYAKVKLFNSLNPEEDQQMLLTGDCTYLGIPNIQKVDCAYLQVSHHGGVYSSPPCDQNEAVRKLNIPKPLNNEEYKYAFYSANGVKYTHPNPEIMQDHSERGWTKPRETDSAIYGQFWVNYHNVT